MTPVKRVLAKLPSAKKSGKGWLACCPAHDDRNPSLSVSEGDDGTALLKCHTGCTMAAILAAVDLTPRDLFPDKADATPNRNAKPQPNAPTGRLFASACDAVAELERIHGKRSAMWTYHDAAANPVGLVVRWDRSEGKKDIRPVSRHADGWRVGAMPNPRTLYGLPELETAKRVIVTEGEKAADAARSLGFVATTSAGGSQAAEKSNWQPLAGKEVWILPDHDAPGRKYADTVAATLVRLHPAMLVKVLELPNLPESGDLVDWIETHRDATEPSVMRAEIEAIACTVEPEQGGHKPNDADSFQPFPVNALPQLVRRFVTEGAKAIGCDSSYLALPLISALASAIGTTRVLELKRGWYAPSIIWTAIVGESGSMKTPAFKLVMKPIQDRQRKAFKRHTEAMKQYEADLAGWEKCYSAWKRGKSTDEPPAKPEPPPSVRFIVIDTTVEALAPILAANPRGLLLSRDELSGWLGSFDRYAGKGSGDSSNWLSTHTGESITVDRKTGTPRTIHVPSAAVCITGGIQPGILQRAMGAEHRESGLLARLLLAYPPRITKRWTEDQIDAESEADLVRVFDRLYELQPVVNDDGETRPGVVRLSAGAHAIWTAYYDAHAKEQADLSGDLSAAWSKLEEYAARLALVIHFTRWAANDPTLVDVNIVNEESMSAGICLATWFKRETRRVYAILDESEADRDRRRLVEWIDNRGGSVTAREVQQGCGWLKDSGTAKAALDVLCKENRGVWVASPAGRRGQPTRRFTLSSSTVIAIPSEIGNTVDVDSVDESETQPEYGPHDGRLFPDLTRLPD